MTNAQEPPGRGRATGGADATWTVGEKYGFATVRDHGATDPSPVWFTLTAGAVTEARFPRIDLLNLRVLDFVVADPADGYAVRTYDEHRHRADPVERSTRAVDDRSLSFEQRVSATGDRDWTLTVRPVPHPDRDAIVLDVEFEADGAYDVYAVADLALGGCAVGDVASADGDALTAHHTGDTEADPAILDGDGEGFEPAAALCSAGGFDWTSVDVLEGAVHDPLLADGTVAGRYGEAAGNVVLLGRLGAGTDGFSDGVALGFATDRDEAGAAAEARAALEAPFEDVWADYAATWDAYLDGLDVPDSVAGDGDLEAAFNAAAMLVKAADSKTYAGAGIASPSVPWGDAVEANQPADYGYSYVWGRDLYQTFTAFEAMGDLESAIDAAEYVYDYQQREHGFVPQNTYVDGRTRWGGEQLDELAFAAVMAYHLHERYDYFEAASYDYADVANTADYVVATGPWSQQERWEEESGYSPSTVAAEIAGTASAAVLAAETGNRADALAYAGVADHWQAHTEAWMATTTGTEERDETPYYIRANDEKNPDEGVLRTHNNGGGTFDERAVIDGGFLELPRLGVKPWDDEVVRNTLAAYDETIRVDTPHGPAWYRYVGDGYGEKERMSGAPWAPDQVGRGRLWPFFTGERGEYELLAGTEDGDLAPAALLATLAGFANEGRMFPEQVWDRDDDNDFGWAFGEGTSSATPLSWTSAQFIRLAHSVDAGEPVERPAAVTERYARGGRPAPDAGPALDADVAVDHDAGEATVAGTTDGAELVVKTNVETAHLRPDGDFEVTVDVGRCRKVQVVAADGSEDPLSAATTVSEHRHREREWVG